MATGCALNEYQTSEVQERDKDDFDLLDSNDAFAQDKKHKRHARFSAEAKQLSFELECWHQITFGWCHLFTSQTAGHFENLLLFSGREQRNRSSYASEGTFLCLTKSILFIKVDVFLIFSHHKFFCLIFHFFPSILFCKCKIVIILSLKVALHSAFSRWMVPSSAQFS